MKKKPSNDGEKKSSISPFREGIRDLREVRALPSSAATTVLQ